MTFSFTSMVRLLVLLGVVSTAMAISISRLDPPRPPLRQHQVSKDFNINDFFLQDDHRKSRWMDAESGRLTVMPIADNDILEMASCSPWTDESGQRQVVGRWSSRTFRGPSTLCDAVGLARYSFPDGRMLNQVSAEIVPVGPPCWVPGTRAQVLFAAGDGQLYRFGFEPAGAFGSAAVSGEPVDAAPTVVSWSCPKPGLGEVLIGDISWPEDPRLGGRLFASIRICERDETGNLQFSRSQIWWLKVNNSATRIIEVGALFNDDSAAAKEPFNDRSPTVASLPDGSLGLAHTRQTPGQIGWSICLTTLVIDSEHRPVGASGSKTQVFPVKCQPAPLGYSSDGRWLNFLKLDQEPNEPVDRLATSVPADPLRTADPKTP